MFPPITVTEKEICTDNDAVNSANSKQNLSIKQLQCSSYASFMLLTSSPTHVRGPSMLPTLNLVGDVVFTEGVSTRLGKLQLRDLVLLRSPLNPNRKLIRRIVAFEGDRFTYFDPKLGDLPQMALVPMGHVWIQGDNIYASTDSQHFGPIPYGLIHAKVFFRSLDLVMEIQQGETYEGV